MISCLFLMHIDNHQRQEHFLRVDLIDGAQAFNEMCWRVYVRAPLPDVREEFREKTGAHRVGTLVVPVNCPARFIRKTWPARNSRRELVRKVDVFLRREHFLDLPKWFIIGAEHRRTHQEQKRREEARTLQKLREIKGSRF